MGTLLFILFLPITLPIWIVIKVLTFIGKIAFIGDIFDGF